MVLVIEDQADVASMIQLVISRCGHQSLLATNLAEAQQLWGKYRGEITLVLADNTLPDGSGIDFAKEVRAIKPSLPIVITSGMVYAGEPHNFPRLDKPFTIAEFQRILSRPEISQGQSAG